MPSVSVLYPNDSTSVKEYDSLTVRWQATDNIGLDSIFIYYSNDPDTMDFELMGAAPGTIDELDVVIPFGVTEQARIQVRASDISGNEGQATSNNFSVTDNTPPSVSVNTPSNGSIGEIITLTWTADDNTGLDQHRIYYATDNNFV